MSMTFLDVRVMHADLWRLTLGQIAGWGLARIEMHPPSSGPEAELTFGPYAAEDDPAAIVRQLEQRGITILAESTRELS